MPTTPLGIWTPDSSDDWDLTVDLAAMGVSVDSAIENAINSRPRNYLVGTNTERLALSGAELFEGLKFWVTGTRVEWLYSNGAWEVQDTGWVNITTTGTAWLIPSSPDLAPQVRREANGVTIRGFLQAGSGVSLTSVATLPGGTFAPSRTTWYSSTRASSGGSFNGMLSVSPAGVIALPDGYRSGSLAAGQLLPIDGHFTR